MGAQPKVEDFTVQIDGVSDSMYLECPVKGCRWEGDMWCPSIGELLVIARSHLAAVHEEPR